MPATFSVPGDDELERADRGSDDRRGPAQGLAHSGGDQPGRRAAGRAQGAAPRLLRPLGGQDKIVLAVGKVINAKKVAKHFVVDIADDGLSWRQDENKIAAEAALTEST